MRRAAIMMSTALIALPALFAGVAQAQDRYGPQAEPSLTPVSYAADRPLLTWPGKQAAPSEETAAPAALPQPAPPAPPPASIYTPPPPPPAPAPVARATPPAPMVAPQASLRAPLPPASPAMASASLDMRPLLPPPPHVTAVTHEPQAASPQIARVVTPKPAVVKSKPVAVAAASTPTPPKPTKAKPKAAVAVAAAKPKPPVAVAVAAAAPAPPEPAEPPHRPWSATGPGLPPHIYSTAREFGEQPDPDPVPLSAQFFADSSGGDLAAPPPPLDPRPVPGSQTVGSTASANTPANRARAIALDTPSPDGSSN
jgi:hypothetical protein